MQCRLLVPGWPVFWFKGLDIMATVQNPTDGGRPSRVCHTVRAVQTATRDPQRATCYPRRFERLAYKKLRGEERAFRKAFCNATRGTLGGSLVRSRSSDRNCLSEERYDSTDANGSARAPRTVTGGSAGSRIRPPARTHPRICSCLRFAYKPGGKSRDSSGLSNTTQTRNPHRTGFFGTDRDQSVRLLTPFKTAALNRSATSP
jgi:hypothetical protein